MAMQDHDAAILYNSYVICTHSFYYKKQTNKSFTDDFGTKALSLMQSTPEVSNNTTRLYFSVTGFKPISNYK